MKLKMRNLATCYSEHAIKVSNSHRSGNSNNIYVSPTCIPSVQDEVSVHCIVKLATHNQLFITLTWATHSIDFAFTISINESHPSNSSSKSFCLKKIKGSKKLEPFDSKIEIIWDLSRASYETGPEPIKGYFVAVLVNSELVLIGDIEDFEAKKLVLHHPIAKYSLVSRMERFSGIAEFSSRAKFFDTGTWHDITITCAADDRRVGNSLSLSVSIDKKNVIQVKRLRWNFRGNQTVFLDGMVVDLMWDVHDWFFESDSNTKSTSRAGIFLFRPRSGLASRLWLEDKYSGPKEEEKVGTSLLIYACKNPD